MILEVLVLADHGHGVVRNDSVSQMSSQTPLATVMSTVDTGEVKSLCFDNIFLFLKN